MDLQEVVNRRRMVRHYVADRPVPDDMVERIVSNALHAPSAGFSQGFGFLVLDQAGDVARFREAAASEEGKENWFAATFDAPLVIVPCSSKDAYLDATRGHETWAAGASRWTMSSTGGDGQGGRSEGWEPG